jgi:RNA exonuclease 4
MDTNGLSSNWKKLQATLKRGSTSTSTSISSPAKKRKASDPDSGHGTVKKQKPGKEQTKARDTKTPYKRKRMSDGAEVSVKTANGYSASSALRRKSSAGVSAQTETGSRNGKVNEGRSPT